MVSYKEKLQDFILLILDTDDTLVLSYIAETIVGNSLFDRKERHEILDSIIEKFKEFSSAYLEETIELKTIT